MAVKMKFMFIVHEERGINGKVHGPFSTRETAEKFAIALVGSLGPQPEQGAQRYSIRISERPE